MVVIIIQMRRAKLELCPSPSGWLTVTNSSLIHPDHQLYTGQRRPERQEEAQSAARRSARRSSQGSALLISVLLLSSCHRRSARTPRVCGGGWTRPAAMRRRGNAEPRTSQVFHHVRVASSSRAEVTSVFVLQSGQGGVRRFQNEKWRLTARTLCYGAMPGLASALSGVKQRPLSGVKRTLMSGARKRLRERR